MTDWTLDWRIYPWASFNSLIDPPSVAPDADGDNLSLCINREYLPYLLGAIAPLTFPDFYTGDSDAQALAANYFQQVFYMLISAGACPLPFNVRQNEENPCLLEKSDDGGVTWTTFANLQLCPPLLVLGQGGVPEISSDGGETYTPVPSAPSIPQPPPPAGQDGLCIACQNAVNVMKALYDQTVSYFNNGVNVIVVVTGIVSLVAIMIFIPLDFTIALTTFISLWEIMTTIVSYEFSSDDQATFLCDLYSNSSVSEAGVVTFNFSAVVDNVDGRWGLTTINQWTLVSYLLQIIGSSGLNNSASVQSATSADCSDCTETWCFLVELSGTSQHFEYDLPGIAGTITDVVLTLSSSACSVFHAGYIDDSGRHDVLDADHYHLSPDETVAHWFDLSQPGVLGWFWDEQGDDPPCVTPDVVSIQFTGTGANPFGESNC